MIKNTILSILSFFLLTSSGYAQNTQQLISEVAQTYTGSESSGNGLIAGFSLAGLIAGLLFGSIGLVAFIYGKKNSEFKPMIIGILLMGYPYFLKNTIVLYVVGAVLTFALFMWRD